MGGLALDKIATESELLSQNPRMFSSHLQFISFGIMFARPPGWKNMIMDWHGIIRWPVWGRGRWRTRIDKNIRSHQPKLENLKTSEWEWTTGDALPTVPNGTRAHALCGGSRKVDRSTCLGMFGGVRACFEKMAPFCIILEAVGNTYIRCDFWTSSLKQNTHTRVSYISVKGSPPNHTWSSIDQRQLSPNDGSKMNLPLRAKLFFAILISINLIVLFRSQSSPVDSSFDIRHNVSCDHLNSTIDRFCDTLHQPQYCFSSQLVVLIHSALDNRHFRDLIRRYSRRFARKWQFVFVVGVSLNSTLNQAIDAEYFLFGDLLQGNFIDSYRNLTRKHLLGLTWAVKTCGETRFVLKVDDDIFVNYYLLERYFRIIGNDNRIFCYHQQNMTVIRDKSSKWFVDLSEYSHKEYPSFCSGWAYISPLDVIAQWLCFANQYPLFWIDDVFITGILRQNTKSQVCPINRLYNMHLSTLLHWLQLNGLKKWNYLFSDTNNEANILHAALQINYLSH